MGRSRWSLGAAANGGRVESETGMFSRAQEQEAGPCGPVGGVSGPEVHSSDVVRLRGDGREFILVGTAHISRESADLVRQVIDAERPDCVCIELDERRYAALSQKNRFESLDLKQIIRQQQLTTLFLNLILVAYQQQLGGKLGVSPGSEFLEAAAMANELGIPTALCDRDVRVTLRRAWGTISAWRRFVLFGSVLQSAFNKPTLTEDDLRQLRDQDVGTRLINELGQEFPGLKTVLIDERDTYLAEKIRRSPGARVVAVVGAGHMHGIRASLSEAKPVDLAALETVPPASDAWKWIGWGMPAVIFLAIAWIGWRQGVGAAGDNLLFWVLITGVPSMLGALLALAHPLTVLTALVAAPVTSLTPVLGVGYVAAFAEAYLRPPRVHEFQSVAQDFNSARQWWKNRLLRILLVFLLSTLFGATGTLIGGAKIVRNLF
jgi:pheromone shutdown-related protein TraB